MLFKHAQLTVTLNKAYCQNKRSITETPTPGRQSWKTGGATPFYSVALAGNYLSPVINLTSSQIFSYDLLHHGLFYTA
jgi:hypothetical protein